MSGTRMDKLVTVLDAKAATGIGASVDVSEYRHIAVEIYGSGNANLTVKCQGSIRESAPTFTDDASDDRGWDYTAMYDQQNANLVNGDTGIAFAGADDVRIFKINVDGLKFINFRVTAWVAGNVTVLVRPFNNQ